LDHGFNPTTGGLRSWAKERRAAGKEAEKATSAAVPLTTSSHEHSESSEYEIEDEAEVMS
jgi:hypothetical protein